VAVDVTSMFGVRTGVGRFTTELVGRLATLDDLSIVGFAATWRGRGRRPPGLPPGVELARRPMPARPLHELWRRWPWPPVERWTGPVSVVHGTNYVVPPARRAGQLATVHDLTILHHPQLAEPGVRRLLPLVRAAVGRGAHVHTVSRYVAEEVLNAFDPLLDAERLHVVPNGVTPVVGDAKRARRLAGPAPFILALGAIEPRKQLPVLVRAFDLVAAHDRDVALVVAGPDGWGLESFEAAVAAASHRDRIIRVGWVDEQARADLLAAAEALAFPSLYEGFGLPPLEAMGAGTPVVASNAGAIPEVVGDAALLVDPFDADLLAAAIERVLTDQQLRSTLVERGRAKAATYSWERTASEIVEVYAELARG
jgi:glycosyltransferase involved in cell wall biosynthesis